jgi:hypothetical protein
LTVAPRPRSSTPPAAPARTPAPAPRGSRGGPAMTIWRASQIPAFCGQAVPAHRERHREIEEDLRRVVHRERAPPPGQRRRQHPVQPTARTVSVSSSPPACDTTHAPQCPRPGTSRTYYAYPPGRCSCSGADVDRRQATSSLLRGTFQLFRQAHPANHHESPRLGGEADDRVALDYLR